MLVLSRKIGETVVIGDDVQLKVLSVKGNRVRLGIGAPPGVVTIRRGEIPPLDKSTAEAELLAPGAGTGHEMGYDNKATTPRP
jgi:carbon storage regulator